MTLDPFDQCPCGSGKKFKWCCQPIHAQIDRAFQMDAAGQHDAALRVVDEAVAAFPDNPEVYGRKAQLLYQNNRVDDAENALQKAFELNPNYPFGLLLQGLFRQQEGEMTGALMAFRKAAAVYHPEAHDFLGRIYALIFESELRLNRPVAAHAALKIAVRHAPGDTELRQAQDELYGQRSRLPAAARRDYTFLSPPAGGSPERRAAWDKALAAADQLPAAARAFEELTRQDENDTAAWHNLGLARAWLGDNRGAVEALDRYITLESDESRAAEMATLGEVLRCGHGMEEQSDYLESATLFQIRNPEQFFGFLDQWQRERRFIVVQVNQEQGIITGMVLEQKPNLTPELAATQLAGLGAYLMIAAGHLRLWHTNGTALALVREEIQQRIGPALSPPRNEQGMAGFADLLADVIAFPLQAGNEEDARKRMREHHQRYFEDTWIHRPRKSLNQIPPVDAAGHANLRKKLRGVIQFLQDCAALTQVTEYDFDRLRRKLGLLPGGSTAAAAAEVPATAAAIDIGGMGAAELAGLLTETMPEEQLEQAYQTALKLDARDLAGRFARTLVERPFRPERPRDRFPWYSHLLQLSLAEGDLDAALSLVEAGDKADAAENEGRRHNDYDLRKAQILAKRGDLDAAQQAYEGLIQRSPAETRYYGTAAETMLSAKQGARALQFAEKGLAEARKQNNRDAEQHFLELTEAARRASK